MSTQLHVTNRVLTLYEENYKENSSEEFKEGFLRCLHFITRGIKKEDHYNLNLRVYQLERENHEKDQVIKKQREEMSLIQKRINQASFISGVPLPYFKVFEVANIVTLEDKLIVVTNMDKEMFLNVWGHFILRYKWTKVDECKSKLISYINRFEAQGYKAYKDVKTAKKEGVQII